MRGECDVWIDEGIVVVVIRRSYGGGGMSYGLLPLLVDIVMYFLSARM